MNERLRETHLGAVTFPGAADMYDALCQEYKAKNGALTEAAQRLIGDCIKVEQLKQKLHEDILMKGVREEYSNGRQKGTKENKSVASFARAVRQMEQLLVTLNLTPGDTQPIMDDGFDDL